jgi:hypothetical protein
MLQSFSSDGIQPAFPTRTPYVASNQSAIQAEKAGGSGIRSDSYDCSPSSDVLRVIKGRERLGKALVWIAAVGACAGRALGEVSPDLRPLNPLTD